MSGRRRSGRSGVVNAARVSGENHVSRTLLLFSVAVVISIACHPGPVVEFRGKQPPVGGTIAGMVTPADSTIIVAGRKINVTERTSGSTFETTTASNGGYTLQVPKGTYHIDIELYPGESLSKRPDDTHIVNGDLDPHRDFVIAASR
jgi:hypothetical protein